MRISISGDVSITEVCKDLFSSRQTKELFGNVIDIFNSCDRNIVNLECAVTDKDTAIHKFGPNLCAPFGTVEVLKYAGVTDCALSNNHILDFGIPGLNDTIAELKKNGLGYTGIGDNNIDARKDMIIDGDRKIAIINVCEHEYSYALSDRAGAREYDPYDTTDDIISAKRKADFVVVIYHGGKEHCRYPSPRLMKLCRSMVHHGADVVLCQHSHCIGCYEEYKGGHILYGQGNFHFIYPPDKLKDKDMWNTGLIAVIDFTDKCSIEFIPTLVDGNGIRLANDEERTQLIDELGKRSLSLKDGSWTNGWREFCHNYERMYAGPINVDEKDRFAHYLDCEAHTDVWRELYKTWHLTER